MGSDKIKAGIVGASGMTGGELLRLLLLHPEVEVSFLYSSSLPGTFVWEVHHDLLGETDLSFEQEIRPCEVIFLCLPHGKSKEWLEVNKDQILPTTKIIDLGNDFRLEGNWNGSEFVYGLCEWNSEEIKNSDYLANPGCFATAIQLGLNPIAGAEPVEEVHCVGITGSTGAGKSLVSTTQFSWRSNNISAYKTFTHQHLDEIQKHLTVKNNQGTKIHFVPWRGDFTRGIFVTLLGKTKLSFKEVQRLYLEAYEESPFVHFSTNSIDLKQVVGTNKALIQVEMLEDQLAVHVALDNLLKGASGQAVQNMNLMFGLDPTVGLRLKATVY